MVFSTSQDEKTVNGIQNGNSPFHANAPVLKKVNTPPGTNRAAAQMLKYPSQRGNSGLALLSDRIASAKAKDWMIGGDTAMSKKNHPKASRRRITSGLRSGRNAATLQNNAHGRNKKFEITPLTSCV